MTLTNGTRLGPYEILSPLGAGGMGEVYRARDTRLGRDVAVKVLPQHLSDNPEVRLRFEREAKTISSLNHPNICTLFDVGREGETDYLVMELIEGTTLAERLQRGALPPAELLRLGTQIADALDRAHRAGVIHRDLKPGNVMLTKSGAKLMDFGLSRVTGFAGGAGASALSRTAISQSPTIAHALTAEGSLLGTFQYMAPEQLEGGEADARSDIWALGCVLYEMATGRRAFEGRSQASLIAAILEREPPPVGEPASGAPASTTGGPPHGVERLIRNCLAKDPDERIQTAHDVRLQLQGIAETAGVTGTSVIAPASVVAQAAAARARSSKLAWGLAALGIVAAIAAVSWAMQRQPALGPTVRFSIPVIAGKIDQLWPRLSPDGRFLMVAGIDSANTSQMFVRPVDQLNFNAVPGTEGVTRAYWSPDGREIVFVKDRKLQRVAIEGGATVTVCEAIGFDLSWGSKGHILMDGAFTDSLRVVAAGGGELRPAARISRADHEIGTAWPCFLPDGEHFLFIGNTSDQGGGNIRLGKLGTLDSKLLGPSDGRVEYAPGDWVVFVRGTLLMAQKLDLRAGKLTGEPITIVDQLRFGGARGHFSTSGSGLFAFCRPTEAGASNLVRADRAGKIEAEKIVSGSIVNPVVSHSGRRIVFMRTSPTLRTAGDMFVYDLDRKTETRLTFTDNRAFSPVWSPDDERIAYVVRPPGGRSVVRMVAADGLGAQDSILMPAGWNVSLKSWTRDGRRLIAYNVVRARVFSLDVGTPGAVPTLVGDSTLSLVQGSVSPDGRWLVATGGRTPDFQILVTSLTGEPGRWQVSVEPGINPMWSKDGRELLWENFNKPGIMAADIDATTGFHSSTPRMLFSSPARSTSHETLGWGSDLAGEAFYLIAPPRGSTVGLIEVVTRFEDLVSRK